MTKVGKGADPPRLGIAVASAPSPAPAAGTERRAGHRSHSVATPATRSTALSITATWPICNGRRWRRRMSRLTSTPQAGPAAYPATPTWTLPFMAASATPAVGGAAPPSQPPPPSLVGDFGGGDPASERQRQLAAHVAFLEAKCADLARQLQESYDLVRPLIHRHT
jgi:hypothetical protein